MHDKRNLDEKILRFLDRRIETAINKGAARNAADLRAVVATAASDAKAEGIAKGWQPLMAAFLAMRITEVGAELVASISDERARLNPAGTIVAELAGLGVSKVAAGNIARHTISRYLRDATELHNTGRRAADGPSDDLPAQVAGDDRAAAATIMLALTRLSRAAGGLSCPEIGLPMAYAAEAVLAARRTAQRSTGRRLALVASGEGSAV